MTKYKNPWYKPAGDHGPEYYSTSAVPIEHAGCLIYERKKDSVWDVVKDGVCIHQRVGLRGAMDAAEEISKTVS